MNSAGTLGLLLSDAVRFGGKPFAAMGHSIAQHPVAAGILPAFGAGLGASMANNLVSSALFHRNGSSDAKAANAHGDTLVLFSGNPASDATSGYDDVFERIGRGAVHRLREWDVQ
ncbi:MAG: hypothetical protein AB7P76_06755 [Candidatus Melainabacteria bacterium]